MLTSLLPPSQNPGLLYFNITREVLQKLERKNKPFKKHATHTKKKCHCFEREWLQSREFEIPRSFPDII